MVDEEFTVVLTIMGDAFKRVKAKDTKEARRLANKFADKDIVDILKEADETALEVTEISVKKV